MFFFRWYIGNTLKFKSLGLPGVSMTCYFSFSFNFFKLWLIRLDFEMLDRERVSDFDN